MLLLVAAAVTLSAHALSTLQAVLAAPAQQLAAQVCLLYVLFVLVDRGGGGLHGVQGRIPSVV